MVHTLKGQEEQQASRKTGIRVVVDKLEESSQEMKHEKKEFKGDQPEM